MFQFSIRSLLILTLYVALAMSTIQIFGSSIVPSITGIVSAVVGYRLAVYWRRASVYRVMGAYFFGASVGMVVFDLIERKSFGSERYVDALFTAQDGLIVTALLAGGAAAWSFRRLYAQPLVLEFTTNMRLARIFRHQRIALQLWATAIVTTIASILILNVLATYYQVVSQLLDEVLGAALCVTLVFIFANMVAICHDVFRIVRSEIGIGYAIGYMFICVILGPISLIWVPLLLPLVISDDVNRWRQWEEKQNTQSSNSLTD